MSGGFDLAAIRRGHQHFLAHLQRSLEQAVPVEQVKLLAWRYVSQHSRFKSRTGNLVKKTGARMVRTRGGRLLRLVNTARYAGAQDLGSGLYGPRHAEYLIRPKRRKALSFISGGKSWVRAGVKHPGVRPTHFLYNAADGVGRAIRPWVEGAMRDSAEVFNRGNRS